ncbi:hypothetical protein ACL2DZ_00110 (plasmid) [Sinorhizobium meliloti]
MAMRDSSASIDLIQTIALSSVPAITANAELEVRNRAEGEPGDDPWKNLREVSDDQRAVVNGSSLISFVAGLDAVQMSDVIDSTQFAARAADAKFNRTSQIRLWYENYVDLLTKLGWVTEGFAFKKSVHNEGTLKLCQEALGIIAAVATGNQLAILKSTLDALKTMAGDSRQIRLFDFNVSVETGGNFQIGAAEDSGNGAIAMAMGAFYYRSNDQRKNALFINWGSHDIEMWTSAQKMTLDPTFYASLRDPVRQRLGTKSAALIASIQIA